MPHTLLELPYAYDALEPHIDARTMEIHHSKHHQGYVDKLNAALKSHQDLQDMPIEQLLSDLSAIPEDIRTAVQNNGGGHANHSLFWQIMSPDGGGEPTGALAEAITKEFDDFATFQHMFSDAAAARFGSGWAWLVKNGDGLAVMSTANQGTPISEGKKPILGLDVWEHAYYLHYQNKRPDYVTAWWNVVNWDEVARRYESA